METARSVHTVQRLPDPHLAEAWERIYTPPAEKDRLIRYLRHSTELSAAKISATALATRRGILLYGPPGCGKTSLACGAPNFLASIERKQSLLVRVDAHALPSAQRGGTQQNVRDFVRDVSEIARMKRDTYVLLDEAETAGTDRSTLSGETNPADTVYGVNALLEGLDTLVRDCPNLVFLLTTNLPRALDLALYERVDFRLYLGYPDPERRRLILQDAWKEVTSAGIVSPCSSATSETVWEDLVAATEGLSPRRIRHLVIQALAEVNTLSDLRPDHLLLAARRSIEQEQDMQEKGGVYTHHATRQ